MGIGSPHFHYMHPQIKHRSSGLAVRFYLLSRLAGPMSGSFKSNSSSKYLYQESNENSEQSPALILRFLRSWKSRCEGQREAECGSKDLHRELLTAQTREASQGVLSVTATDVLEYCAATNTAFVKNI